MIIVELTYKKTMDEVEKHLTDHRNFLQKYYDNGLFLASGPKDPRTGGIIVTLGDKAEIAAIIEQDPFYVNEIADYKVTVFDPVKFCVELKDRIENR